MGDTGQVEELIGAVVKGIVAVVLVGALVYSLVMGVPVSDQLMSLVLAVLAAYFGLGAVGDVVRVWKLRGR